MIPDGAIISGIISKVINDLVDVSKDKIKKADSDRKTENQSFETRVYQVIIDAINEFTYDKYKNRDVLYDTAENILNGFKNGESNIIAVKTGLSNVVSNVDESGYEKFIRVLCHEISKENNFDVYKEVVLINQGQETKYNHELLQRMDKKLDHLSGNAAEKDKNFRENDNLQNSNIKQKAKSRTQEYLDKWNANMFLNDFNERDENAGVNVKLSDIYLEKHLPHYIWGDNENESSDLMDLLSEYIYEKNKNKMLLILGQPGIGKSTLITWITANFIDELDNILVYQFASDLKNIDLTNISENYNIMDDILMKLDLSYNYLDGKTLIFDGFDEVRVENRIAILNKLFWSLAKNDSLYDSLNEFSVIITCRENYIQDLSRVHSDYITLQAWNSAQIQSFCKVYQEITKVKISDNAVENILENKSILGIPLVLYMVLALEISIEEDGSIVDVYDKIFSLQDGGIYDRCLQNKRYEGSHRISEIKEQIHQISREIAIWMFENNPNEAYIPQKEYEKICNHIMEDYVYDKEDFKIGNFFKSVKHCEGIETEELYFVHRSIYEYFVAETIYSSIENAMIENSCESQKELAGSIAGYLKLGEISFFVGEYLQYKVNKLYIELDSEKKQKFYQWWEDSVHKMVKNGMFYYTEKGVSDYKDILKKEINCFSNLIKILKLLRITNKDKLYIMENFNMSSLRRYIKCYYIECENKCKTAELNNICLKNMELVNANFSRAKLEEANLQGANLQGAILKESSLRRADIEKANLSEANLSEADLSEANLNNSVLNRTNFHKAHLSEAKLNAACLLFANFSAAYLNKVELRDADLRCADLRSANLEKADLEKADFRGTNLNHTVIRGANIEGSIWYRNDIPKLFLQLKEANFTYIFLEDRRGRKKVYRKELFSGKLLEV